MKESEIRPEALLRRYLELSAQDAANCFGNEPRMSIPCMACGRLRVEHDFDKHRFAYGLRRFCGTLYQTPRQALSAFKSFYRDSMSSNYWAEVFFGCSGSPPGKDISAAGRTFGYSGRGMPRQGF